MKTSDSCKIQVIVKLINQLRGRFQKDRHYEVLP
jgi:hypothetical protein